MITTMDGPITNQEIHRPQLNPTSSHHLKERTKHERKIGSYKLLFQMPLRSIQSLGSGLELVHHSSFACERMMHGLPAGHKSYQDYFTNPHKENGKFSLRKEHLTKSSHLGTSQDLHKLWCISPRSIKRPIHV